MKSGFVNHSTANNIKLDDAVSNFYLLSMNGTKFGNYLAIFMNGAANADSMSWLDLTIKAHIQSEM